MPKFDELTESERRALMARIRKIDTKPELAIRRLVHAMGFRYRLYRRDLPGTPDLVFPSRKKVIFVHGCFWHRHDCASGRKLPSRNLEYWQPKLARNRARDQENIAKLKKLGWKSLVIWECQVSEKARLERRIRQFLES